MRLVEISEAPRASKATGCDTSNEMRIDHHDFLLSPSHDLVLWLLVAVNERKDSTNDLAPKLEMLNPGVVIIATVRGESDGSCRG